MRLGYITLPHRGIASNDTYFKNSQYYWDTYFSLLGLVVSAHVDLAREAVENELWLFGQMGVVPARNSRTSAGRTQPPFLTSMIWEIYDHETKPNLAWAAQALTTVKAEYNQVWGKPPRLSLHTGLNRYSPRFSPTRLFNYESGWDFSTRFLAGGRMMIPVDLNCMLYQYETDFLRLAKLQNDKAEMNLWRKRMSERKAKITLLCWHNEAGFFYDYNRLMKRPTKLKTLAGFFPLWANVATKAQAARMVEHLADFEHRGGLATTTPLPWRTRQWDYPNGWANLHWIVIQGLRNYGYNAEAERIASKWLELNARVFKQTGALWEKYDVVKLKVGRPGRYRTPAGFGWTNGVFLRLLNEFSKQ